MPTSQMSEVIQHLRRAGLLQDAGRWTDGQLLECFVSRREPAALGGLVRRHGPMVWGVCRRLLGNHHDAEDAFQATFLVLVRKAASIYPRAKVGDWLYGVARQTALKARATRAKRRVRERSVTEMPEPAVTEPDLWGDLQPLLDLELGRLPEKYRTVIVLCDLGGKTGREASRQLGVPQGTVASRLARARAMLANRLARRGLAVTGGALGAVLSRKAASASVPPAVLSSTLEAVTLVAAGRAAAAGMISARTAALTEGVMKAMLLSKLKAAMAMVLALAITGVGVGHLLLQTRAAEPPEARQADEGPKAPKPEDAEEETQEEVLQQLDQLVGRGQERETAKEVGRTAVRDVLAGAVAALNRHDAKAFAAVFHTNAEFHIGGATALGPRGIALAHRRFFEGGGAKPGVASFKGAVVTVGEPRIRFLRPDVATVDVRWAMAGALGPDGKDGGIQRGFALLVLTREKGTWGVATYRLGDVSPALVKWLSR
jgi:uncharacterized protein (TIGR02246 family)